MDGLRPFSLLVKPVGGACNLACDYCFYTDVAPRGGPSVLSRDLVERMLTTYLAQPFDSWSIVFQGGEPLLAGLDFFRFVEETVQRLVPIRSQVHLAVQTNGTLLTDDWARFFATHDWLVGISIDGPAAVHDAHRRGVDGSPTHAAVLRGLDTLRAAGCAYNVLTLVTVENRVHPAELYAYVRDELGGTWQQYTDYRGRDPTCACVTDPQALTTAHWDDFLCGILDAWLAADDPGRVSVRNIDAGLAYALYGRADQCIFSPRCADAFVVERNGDIYPCDFHVRPDCLLGNLATHTWQQIWQHPVRQRLARTACPRHLAHIPAMRFYDRLAELAVRFSR